MCLVVSYRSNLKVTSLKIIAPTLCGVRPNLASLFRIRLVFQAEVNVGLLDFHPSEPSCFLRPINLEFEFVLKAGLSNGVKAGDEDGMVNVVTGGKTNGTMRDPGITADWLSNAS